jgi:hypothetical protein
MLTDVAKAGSAEQCVSGGMRNHISIAVPNEHALAWKRNATQNEDAAFDWCVCKSVNVETLTDTNVDHQISPASNLSA